MKKYLIALSVVMAFFVAQSQLSAQPAFYVFNADQQRGFVIISGDDRLPSVLGYSERGSYVDEDMPENMRSWLQAVSDNIDYMQRMNVTRPIRAIKCRGLALCEYFYALLRQI